MRLLDYFNPHYIYEMEENTRFSIEEKNSQNNGQGKSYFQSLNKSIIIQTKDNTEKIWCLKNKKCAEAAFITIDSAGNCTLNLVEMKSTLTQAEFSKVIAQFEGMYLVSIAIMSILKLGYPSKIKAFIAYKEERLSSPYELSNPYSMNKQLVGKKSPMLDIWNSECFNLPHNVSATLIKGKRILNNNSYDYDFGLI